MTNKLGDFIRAKRGDMSLRDFAHLCDDVSHGVIDKLERGDNYKGKSTSPSVDTLAKIAKGTGVSVAYLAALANGEEPLPLSIIDEAKDLRIKEIMKLYNELSEEGKQKADTYLADLILIDTKRRV